MRKQQINLKPGTGQHLSVFMIFCLLLLPVTLFGQGTIEGVVLDNNENTPLPGAYISIQGTATGTISDANGKFSLEAGPDAVLVISYVGYLTETVEIGGQKTLTVALTPDLAKLDEIVVIGYGTVKKSDITGSIVSVDKKALTTVKSGNVMEALQGNFAGVQVTRENGRSNSEIKVNINAQTSPFASSTPLFIVDGIPYGKDININANDIESLEILKDASSTAIYGSRGANGVILITTKKGKAGKSNVFFNAYYGVSQPYQKIPVFDRDGYIKARFDAFRDTANWDSIPSPDNVFGLTGLFREGYDNGYETDWQDLVSKNGSQQDYHLGLQGGSENITYNASINYFAEDGVVLADKYNRYNITMNVQGKINKWLSTGATAILTYDKQDGRGPRFTDAVLMPPNVKVYDTTGEFIYRPAEPNSRVSPLSYIEDVEEIRGTKVFSTAFLQVDIFKGLSFRTNLGATFSTKRFGYMYPLKGNSDVLAQSGVENTYNQGYLWNNILSYSNTFKDHSITVTAVHEMKSDRKEIFNLKGTDQPYERQLWYNLSSGSNQQTISSLTETALLSFLGRVSYSYKEKSIVSASGRYDGASQLSEGHKWEFFPSASMAWRMSKESFLSPVDFISDLKLRVGYGVSGNASVDPYGTQSLLSPSINYEFGKTDQEVPAVGYRPYVLAVEDLTWEKTTEWNMGIDFGFLSNRIYGSVDYYSRVTNDVLLEAQMPTSTGFDKVWDNVGKTSSHGFGMMLHTVNISNRNFKWSTDVSLYTDRDEILELASGQLQDESNKLFVGEPIGVYYDYKKIGIWQLDEKAEALTFNQAPGDIKVQNTLPDTVIGPDDRVVLGQKRPKFTWNFNSSLDYKGIELSFGIYSLMGQMIDAGAYAFDPRMYDNMLEVDYWTPLNPTNDYPRLNGATAEADYEYSLRYRDGSFIKLRHVTLAYTFPLSMTSKMKMSNLRIYVSAKNPLILYSKLEKGIDPEREGSINWPLARLFLFGVDVQF